MQVSSRPSQRACKSRLDTCDGRLERRADPHATEHATGTDIHTHVLSRERRNTPCLRGRVFLFADTPVHTLWGCPVACACQQRTHMQSIRCRRTHVPPGAPSSRRPRLVSIAGRCSVDPTPLASARAAARRRPSGPGPVGAPAQRLAAPRTVRATRGASEHPRVPIFFSAFALRSIIQHKYVAPPAQNPYGLYSMMPCMAAPLPPEPRGPVPLLVPRSLLVQPWAVLGHSVRCTRASMASVPLTPL